MDIRLIRRLAALILTGHLTKRYTPRDAARDGWTAERYVAELWPLVPPEFEAYLAPEDLDRLREALEEKVKEAMEEA